MITPLPLFNPDTESVSWNLAHAIPTAPQPHKYLIFERISLPILSQCFFSKSTHHGRAPIISDAFLNIYLDSASISYISKHSWNTFTSYCRYLFSAPNVHNQIWGIIQRYVTKMPRSCFSGLDVETFFFRSLEFIQSNSKQDHGIHIYSHIISHQSGTANYITVFQLWIYTQLF